MMVKLLYNSTLTKKITTTQTEYSIYLLTNFEFQLSHRSFVVHLVYAINKKLLRTIRNLVSSPSAIHSLPTIHLVKAVLHAAFELGILG